MVNIYCKWYHKVRYFISWQFTNMQITLQLCYICSTRFWLINFKVEYWESSKPFGLISLRRYLYKKTNLNITRNPKQNLKQFVIPCLACFLPESPEEWLLVYWTEFGKHETDDIPAMKPRLHEQFSCDKFSRFACVDKENWPVFVWQIYLLKSWCVRFYKQPRLVLRSLLSKAITGVLNFELSTNICIAIDTIKYICHIKIVT